MKRFPVLLPFLALLATAAAGAPAPRAADRASIHAILITASNNPGASDRRLAPYEPTLRRVLRFQSYRFLGDGSASLDVPATGSISLPQGHRLELETEQSSGGTVRVKVAWTHGGRTLMGTGLALRPGVPAVLGGPGTGQAGEVYAVILVGR